MSLSEDGVAEAASSAGHDAAQSRASAATGFILDAFRAGRKPKTRPIRQEQLNARIIDPIE
jgi:hypothetical protein